MVTLNVKTNVISDIIPQCVLTTTAKYLNVSSDAGSNRVKRKIQNIPKRQILEIVKFVNANLWICRTNLGILVNLKII